MAAIASAEHVTPARMPNSDATSVTATMNANPSVTAGTDMRMCALHAPTTRAKAIASTEARPAPWLPSTRVRPDGDSRSSTTVPRPCGRRNLHPLRSNRCPAKG